MPIGNTTFEDWYKTLPKEKNDTTSYNLKRAYELADEESLKEFAANPDAHLYSAYENKETGDYEFVKSKNHPTIDKELEWYNSDDAAEFRNQYELFDDGSEYYKYKKKKTEGDFWVDDK